MAEKIYIIDKKQGLLDACIQVYGASSFLFRLAKDNNLLFDAVVNIGDELIYEDTLGDAELKNKIAEENKVINNPGLVISKIFELFNLWLKSDTGLVFSEVLGEYFVDSWEDQSGNNYNVSQIIGSKRPKIINDNGFIALEFGFSGVGSSLDMINELEFLDHELFIVYKATNVVSLTVNYLLSASVGRNSSSIKYSMVSGGNLGSLNGYGAGSVVPSASLLATTKPVNEKTIISITKNKIFRNNVEENYSVQQNVSPAFIDRIGTRQDISNENGLRYMGNLYELIVTRELLASERKAVFDYLQTKYNLLT